VTFRQSWADSSSMRCLSQCVCCLKKRFPPSGFCFSTFSVVLWNHHDNSRQAALSLDKLEPITHVILSVISRLWGLYGRSFCVMQIFRLRKPLEQVAAVSRLRVAFEFFVSCSLWARDWIPWLDRYCLRARILMSFGAC